MRLGVCTRQFAAVIPLCTAELTATIQGESILEAEKKYFKTQVAPDFGAWHGHFCRVGVFFGAVMIEVVGGDSFSISGQQTTLWSGFHWDGL